jgi:5-methylcytosine-specific restriction enzyme subunit McrC
MPEPGVVNVAEYESVDVSIGQLTESDLARLRALQNRGVLTAAEMRGGWQIKANATVGVLTLDRIRLMIAPKFAIDGDQLMQWLAYALAVPVPHPTTSRRWATRPHGYAELAASALLTACDDLLREGLRRDYIRHECVQPILRGRLDIAAQTTRRYGQLDQLHTRTFDRDLDIWENRVLNSALRRASRLVTNPELARALQATAVSFPTDPAPAAALLTLRRAQYTRLNARYLPAHRWAELLLRGGGVNDLLGDAGMRAESLLLHMPGLWEHVTRRMLSQAAAAHGAHVVPSGRRRDHHQRRSRKTVVVSA